MRDPRDFYRHSSAEMLEALFAAATGAPIPPHKSFRTLKDQIDWAGGVARAFTPGARYVFSEVMANVGALASDLGVQCLRETLLARRPELAAAFAKLKSDYDRGTWAWLHHRELFEEAVARWFFDRRKPTGTWTDGYVIPSGASFAADEFDIRSALMPIVDQYDAGPPGIISEFYEIGGEEGAPATLLSIFYEGRWNSKPKLKVGAISAVAERVLHHVAVKIEAAAGLMYVVSESRSKKLRNAIARAVAKVGLGMVDGLDHLPPLRYNLQRLLDPAPFAWNLEHGIEATWVSSLILQAPSFGETTKQKTFSSASGAEDVRAQAIAKLSSADRRLARVSSGELRVLFAPRPGRSKGRVVTLGFNGAESCTMDLDCAEEDLLRARYFERWNLYAPLQAEKGFGR